MGLVWWYTPHFAECSAVFNDLTRVSAPNKVHWTKECDRAFRELKDAICTNSVLDCADFDKLSTLPKPKQMPLEQALVGAAAGIGWRDEASCVSELQAFGQRDLLFDGG